MTRRAPLDRRRRFARRAGQRRTRWRAVQSLANLLATVVTIAQTRIELLTTELQEEIHRGVEILIWTLVALLAAAMGLFVTTLVIIFMFWEDTHRVLASVLVASSFFALALAALVVLRAKVRGRPRLLEGTFAELAKDRAAAHQAPIVTMAPASGAAGVSDRARALAERNATLRLRCAVQRRAVADGVQAVESRLQSVDRIVTLARGAVLHPAVIAVGGVGLALIGRARGAGGAAAHQPRVAARGRGAARAAAGQETLGRNGGMIMRLLHFTTAVALGFAGQLANAQTTPLHVLASNGMRAVIDELKPQLERDLGRPLAIEFNTTAAIRQRIDAGEAFDVAVLTAEVIDALAKSGRSRPIRSVRSAAPASASACAPAQRSPTSRRPMLSSARCSRPNR